uniref:Uncharacterized protein n=1 Tax=Chromera velia CCMP2878 TaxID=1169474 RepID=A0A0G4F910_9ALVE|eukprot:Cvel_2978.t1-p1 / transcript=Cvel_2978.t1 / gene=Cvel_2978 / organism=Chromera_velia_CCMP2878 / gene_product=hypothetical protein / transcript_product=hypothetical protein / location=Cvel_scaffold118:66510-67205(+) / protein_length=232 / sequence_SO=supercontig / SO=protein_coding / is_pseudo=false
MTGLDIVREKAPAACVVIILLLASFHVVLARNTVFCKLENASSQSVEYSSFYFYAKYSDGGTTRGGDLGATGTLAPWATVSKGWVTVKDGFGSQMGTYSAALDPELAAQMHFSKTEIPQALCGAKIDGDVVWGLVWDPSIGPMYLKEHGGNVDFSTDPYTITLQHRGDFTSCSEYCRAEGTTGGTIKGRAPWCEATCGGDCGGKPCVLANKSWSEYGDKCLWGTQEKICCCD